ncbi:MAG: helix-turn-helix domain-containing protein [Gemmatimonadaceae bacterium]
MKCDECGGTLATQRDVVRRYDIGGLPHVELHGLELEKCPSCGRENVGIPAIGQLHDVIAHSFVTQSRMLAPVEIRFLRKHIGLSTGDFAQNMGVTRETISRWETGQKPMSAQADRLLRLLVVAHSPTNDYAVDDFLRTLNDTPAPEKLTSVAVLNRKVGGWTDQSRVPTKTNKRGQSLAGMVLSGKKQRTSAEAKKVAASTRTQAPNKKK